MGRITTFRIVFNHPKAVYHAGEIVEGKVYVVLQEALRAKCLTIRAVAKAWAEYSLHNTPSITPSLYKKEKTYFDTKMYLFHSKTIPAGENVYKFHFQLPPNVPSSFEGQWGHVRYKCIANLDREETFKMNETALGFFSVIAPLDLNKEPARIRTPIKTETRKSASGCCSTEDLKVRYRIEKRGFVPGEDILVYTEVHNQGDTTTSVRVALKQCVEYDVYSKMGFQKPSTKTDLKVLESGPIYPGDSKRWNNHPFKVPPVPPSRLDGCNFIDITYYIKFSVRSHHGLDIVSKETITIGTVPLIGRQNSNEDTVITSQPRSTSYGDIHLDIGEIDYDIPPPSYEEYMKGQMTLKGEEGDHEEDGIKWSPAYPVYNLSEIDPLQSTQL